MDWERKQARLRDFLTARGAEHAPYRVDLQEGKIYWVSPLGLSLALADCKMICSYALSNRSILMSWANESVNPNAAIGEMERLPNMVSDCEPEEVWELSQVVGEAVGADALFRATSPQSWIMLALWRLRDGGAEQFKAGSPRRHIAKVLDKLAAHDDYSERRILLDNYAESFLQLASQPHKGSEYEEPLRILARSMRNLLALTDQEMTTELERLALNWSDR